jgi:predicted metal-dependent phosphoesterase TrpH
VKLDTHVHTLHSGDATVFPFNHFMRESYNTPESVYATARRRGMDLVVVTDHDQISGALALGNGPDVLVGCEVTAEFADLDLCVHLNVIDVTPSQYAEIQRLRVDIRELLPYLRYQGIYTSLNHVASGINGPLTGAHVAAILPWVDALEVINGTRLPQQNRTALCVAQAAGKHMIAGSDSHTGRGIGRTWTEVPGARTREEFLSGLRSGRAIPAGQHGGRKTMISDFTRFAGNFWLEAVANTVSKPGHWRGYAQTFGGILGLPVVPLVMAGALMHFVHEQRFNRDLLYELVARPERTLAAVPGLAA